MGSPGTHAPRVLIGHFDLGTRPLPELKSPGQGPSVGVCPGLGEGQHPECSSGQKNGPFTGANTWDKPSRKAFAPVNPDLIRVLFAPGRGVLLPLPSRNPPVKMAGRIAPGHSRERWEQKIAILLKEGRDGITVRERDFGSLTPVGVVAGVFITLAFAMANRFRERVAEVWSNPISTRSFLNDQATRLWRRVSHQRLLIKVKRYPLLSILGAWSFGFGFLGGSGINSFTIT